MAVVESEGATVNEPDENHQRHWKRRSLVVVAVLVLPIVAFMAWPDRPLSSEEQRLVGRWTDQSIGLGNHTVEFRSDRLGIATYGEGYVGEFDWRIQNGQLVSVPYQYRSQKNSIKNLYRHCVLMFDSFSSGSPYPADDSIHFLIKWIDDDTLELTTGPGTIIHPEYTAIMQREPQ